MDLREQIRKEEKDAILNYIMDNVHYDNVAIAPVDHLLRFWNEEKGNLYQLLGNNLMFSREINFHKDTDDLSRDIEDNLLGWAEDYSKAYTFVARYEQFTQDYYNHVSSQYGTFWKLNYLMRGKTLATNIYDDATFDLQLPDGKTMRIQKGSKVSKVLGKIANKFNLEGYEQFRIAHSMALNEKVIHGNLTLSIHPLDYMTMSDNDCDWESCMSWTDDGCYRRGTVEMMNSPYVVCAYLTSETPYRVGGIDWSNKKWRELFIVNEQGIFGIKGYPFWNRELEDIVLDWLKELAATNLGWTNYTDRIYEFGNHRLNQVEGHDITIDIEANAMYNDIYSPDHHAYLNTDGEIFFNYSGASECMICGEESENFDNEGSLACEDCHKTWTCYSCGDTFDSNDTLIEVDGEYYCQYCYEELPVCAVSGEVHSPNNMYAVRLRVGNIIFRNWWVSIYYTDALLNQGIIYEPKDWYDGYVIDWDKVDDEIAESWFGCADKADMANVLTERTERWGQSIYNLDTKRYDYDYHGKDILHLIK